MTHLGHLVRWDVRRFRALLGVWLVIVAATAALDAIWPQLASDPRIRQLAGTIGNLLALTEVLVSAVLIALVVQAHALVGTTAFWMTRPLPPATLLGAKLVLLGAAMIAAPIAADVLVMAMYQVPTADIIGVSIQAAQLWALWIGALVIAAAVTPNLPKYALLIGSALIAGVVTISLLVAVTLYRFEDAPPQGQLSMGGGGGPFMFWAVPDPTPDVVAVVLTIATFILVLIAQYRTRRRELALATGVTGFLVVWFLSSFWPWPFLAPAIVTPAWAANPTTLSLTAPADSVALEPIGFGDRSRHWRQARAQIRLHGIEPGWTASVGVRSAAVEMPGGMRLTSNYTGFPSSVPVEEHGDRPQQREVIRTLLEVGTLLDQTPHQRGENTVVLYARDDELSRLAPNDGAYQGRFYVGLTHHTVEAVLPPTRGARHQSGPYRFSIADVQLSSGRLSMLSEQSDAVSAFARRLLRIRSFYLRNRRTSQAIYLQSYDLRADASLMRILPFAVGFGQNEQSGFSARAEMLYFSPRSDQPDAFVLNEQWINEAELVIVSSTPGGSVERQLAIANFPIRSQ